MQEATKTLHISYNASGALQAAKRGDVVVIVDVIDMSTTAEAVLEAGALLVLGASPDQTTAPVAVNPRKIAYQAGKIALKHKVEIILITEPRFCKPEQRLKYVQLVRQGIKQAGASLETVLPNIGAQITKFTDFERKVVIIVSSSGGVAFDAAYNNGAVKVITGTVARTKLKKGIKPIRKAAHRAIKYARNYKTGITLIAASANSYEDILAVEKIAQVIIKLGFLGN